MTYGWTNIQAGVFGFFWCSIGKELSLSSSGRRVRLRICLICKIDPKIFHCMVGFLYVCILFSLFSRDRERRRDSKDREDDLSSAL